MKTFKRQKPSYIYTYCVAFMFIYVILVSQVFGEEQKISGQVIVITINGPIGPATSDYVLNGLDEAVNTSAELVLLKMDTPGGLDTAMRDIIQGIISSPIPIVTFVSPSGARAASAGTYILYASHIAAMAPATTLGAATPVEIGGMPKLPGAPQTSDEKTMEDNEEIEQPTYDKHVPNAMQNKIINDAAAYIRSLAQLRGRNEKWAEEAVRSASSLSAEEAINNNVIDLVATNIEDLLTKLNNYSVKILGTEHKLLTAAMTSINYYEPDWRNKLLSVITDPNILPILMTLGMFGLIYEMLNPGFVLPGVLGGICILLALYAAQVLPINYAGLALILLGILFMIGEAFVPSFGALGIGGVIAFVIGSIILIDTDYEGYGISIPFISTFAAANALFFFTMLSMVLKARHKPVVSGREELIGSAGEVIESVENYGRVRVHSENWQAKSNFTIAPGQKIRVTGIEGLTLIVEPENYTSEELS